MQTDSAAAKDITAQKTLPDEIVPGPDLLAEIERESGVKAGLCFGCKKCTNGCPLTFAMDLTPYQLVRLAQLGQKELILNSHTVWLCASCHTCVTRCPNDVDLPRLMDYLKELSLKEKHEAKEPDTLTAHRLFLREIKARGRVFEASLMARHHLSTKGLNPFSEAALQNARLGLAMLKRGRLGLLPKGTKDRKWLKELFRQPKNEEASS